MGLKLMKPRKALNKAFLKMKPNRSEVENFKVNLIALLSGMNGSESEEFHKNLIIDFFKKLIMTRTTLLTPKGETTLLSITEKQLKVQLA